MVQGQAVPPRSVQPSPRTSIWRAPRSAASPEPGSPVPGGGTEGHRKRIFPCKEMSRSHLTPLSLSSPPLRLTPQQSEGCDRGAKGAAALGTARMEMEMEICPRGEAMGTRRRAVSTEGWDGAAPSAAQHNISGGDTQDTAP